MQFSQSLHQPVLQYQGYYYPLNKPIVIGSDQSCDIRIENNPLVLPMHVRVIPQDGRVFLQYMKRGAAIWVNGSPASQQALQDQDEIAVGDRGTRLTFLLNKHSAGANPQGLWTRASSIENGPGAGFYVAPEAGETWSGGPARPVPPAWSASSPGQSSSPIAVTPAFNGGQLPGASISTPQPLAPRPAMHSKATDTTRYLCAAGHLDEKFQDYVMRHVIYEERRALGESYGVDMFAVVSWCKSGLQRINVRDGILTGLLALAAIGMVKSVLESLGNLASTLSSYGSSYYPFGVFSAFLFAGLLGSLVSIGLALIFLLIAFNVEKWVKRRWPRSHSGIVTYPLLLILCGILFGFFGFLMVPVIWLTIFIELIARYYGESVKHLRKNAFNPQSRPVSLDDKLEKKLQESFVTGQRNVVAYSGFEPFAGAGDYQDGWSLVIDTSKGARDTSHPSDPDARKTPIPFTVSSLYDAVEKDVWALNIQDVLEIEGKIYARGQYLPENPSFFNKAATRPVTSVDPGLVAQYKEHPTEGVRYYQCLRFNFWSGEMIFTAFLRFVQRGKDLFIEVDYLLLPPMKEDYYWVDKREITPPLSEIWQLYKRSLDAPIRIWLSAPFRLFRGYFYAARQRKLLYAALNNPAFDYGAATSLRQEASDDKYHLFFQRLDKEMYLKIIEKQILETIINFLDAHQIDIEEFRQHQQMILNNHTVVNNTDFSGSTFNHSQLSGVGSGAQSYSGTAQAAPRK